MFYHGRILDGLNEQQQRAVTHESGPLLVLAGAGTGKTRTLVARAAWLRDSLGLPPGRDVGRAYQYLLDLRMEHGPLGPGRATQELRGWAVAVEGISVPEPPDEGLSRRTASQ